MAFNNWPYTNFQDLNLGWILNKIKEAITSASAAFAKAEAVETEVDTYSQRISDAETDAETARTIAYSVQADVVNAQSDATSAIAIGRAAQSTANTALSTANSASSIASGAADSADSAVDTAADAARDAATALQLANLASEDYLNVGITVFPSDSPQADKNADQILTAVLANKKIKFTLDDARTGETHTTYDYTIDPVDNTVSDIDINVIFEISVSSSLNKYIIITFHKVVSGGNTTYSITSTDVSFSGGGGGGGISIQDVIDTVNDGDTNALLSTAQTLSAAEKAQVKQNLGISDSGGSYSPYLIPVTQIGNSYSTTATGYDVFDHILDCRIVFNGVYYYQIGSTLSGAFGNAYFACTNPSGIGTIENDIFAVRLNGNSACTITKYDRDVSLLPVMSSADAGKFARVNSSGVWVAETVPSAESNSFGGA